LLRRALMYHMVRFMDHIHMIFHHIREFKKNFMTWAYIVLCTYNFHNLTNKRNLTRNTTTTA
jgi:hypothetical protein